MKKRFLICILFLGLIFSLASCGANSINIINNSTESGYVNANTASTEGVNNTTNSSSMLVADYKKTNATYTTTSNTTTNTIEDTVEEIYESVVSITAKSVSSTSSGSGVLFAEDTDLGLSYIITCFHVIDGATSFSITISDYNDEIENLDAGTYEAKFVGGYEDNDLAILSIEKTGLTYSKIFDDSDKLRLGSDVIAIGNPLGTLPGSVSKGVVSYVNRDIAMTSYNTITVIQTDVAINSGNSGGGLFNSSGALIGIVNAKVNDKYLSSSVEGLGFAIPSNSVKSAISSILSTAEYDINNKEWKAGYVEGDYEFGFTISLGSTTSGTGFYRTYNYVLYISNIDLTNDTYSGTNLKTNTAFTSIKIDYKDSTKDSITYNVPETFTSNTSTEATKFLYNAGLSLGDTVSITYANGTVISFEIIQFIYSI